MKLISHWNNQLFTGNFKCQFIIFFNLTKVIHNFSVYLNRNKWNSTPSDCWKRSQGIWPLKNDWPGSEEFELYHFKGLPWFSQEVKSISDLVLFYLNFDLRFNIYISIENLHKEKLRRITLFTEACHWIS